MTSLIPPDDEPANAITHGVGFLFSLPAANHLMRTASQHSTALFIACSVYSTCLLAVYGVSTLSHSFYDLKWRRRFRTLDQAFIFLLIAATYTPFATLYLLDNRGILLLVGMWFLAWGGACRVLFVRELPRREKLFYGILGLLPSLVLNELWRKSSTEIVAWITIGGACYLAGVPFLCRSVSMRFAHAIWHMFVMAGSACHYWAIARAIALTIDTF